MKKLLPLLLCFTALKAFAQKNSTSYSKEADDIIQHILQKQQRRDLPTATFKSTGMSKRLIALANWSNGSIKDSITYYYSAGRGSTLTNPESYYDKYEPILFDDAQTIKCDSSYEVSITAPPQKNVYTYGAIKPIRVYMSNLLTDETKYISYINDTTRTIYIDSIIGGESYATRFQYDGANRHLSDSTIADGDPNKLSMDLYHYDTNGNVDTFYFKDYYMNGPYLERRLINVYDANNRLTQSALIQMHGKTSFFDGIYKYIYTYSGNSNNISIENDYEWNSITNAWELDYRIFYSYNNNKLVDTALTLIFNPSPDTFRKTVYMYDANDLLLTKRYNYDYSSGSGFTLSSDSINYYYENYWPAAIGNIPTKDIDISLYPNPSNNSIVIKTAALNKGSISIINTMGQVTYRQTHIALAEQTIDIHDLPSGNYTLILQDDKEQQSYQRQFTKL